MFQENSWNRLPFLLDLYGREEFENYQELILEAIGTRDMYGKLSEEQAEVIRKILMEKEKMLPQQLVKNILFDMKFLVSK